MCGAKSGRSVVEITSGISDSSLLVPRAQRTSPRPVDQIFLDQFGKLHYPCFLFPSG